MNNNILLEFIIKAKYMLMHLAGYKSAMNAVSCLFMEIGRDLLKHMYMSI